LALYFTISTLTTVGYGDLVPASDGAKLATLALQLSGIGLFVLPPSPWLLSLAGRMLSQHER
jgi:voltage-gated potassium channel